MEVNSSKIFRPRYLLAIYVTTAIVTSIKSFFYKKYHSPSTIPLLNGTVRIHGFNSFEWPLYGVLSILILLTIAIRFLLLPLSPRHSPYTRKRLAPSKLRGSPLNHPILALVRPATLPRAYSHLATSETFPSARSFACFLHQPRADLVSGAPSISLRIYRFSYPAPPNTNVYGMIFRERQSRCLFFQMNK